MASRCLTAGTILGFLLCLLLIALPMLACAGGSAAESGPDTASAPSWGATATVAPESPATSVVSAAVTAEAAAQPITITDLYDNRTLHDGLRPDWGFSCLVEGYDQTILFDTGANGATLLANMEALGVDPQDIETVVLSHEHGDHTGGLTTLLASKPGLTVYCPALSSRSFASFVEARGATVVRVDAPLSPCPGVTVMAPALGGSASESGLLLDTTAGHVLLTGCAHPGIVYMAQGATTLAGRPLAAVIGGFHLHKASGQKVATVIAQLQAMGVQRCGPAHCTGDPAIALFEEVFGPDFIAMRVGAVVQF